MNKRLTIGFATLAAFSLSVVGMSSITSAITPESTVAAAIWEREDLGLANGVATDTKTANELNRALSRLEQSGNKDAAMTFGNTYSDATQSFTAALTRAATEMQRTGNDSYTSDTYIKDLETARNDYLHRLEDARNKLAEQSGGYGNDGDVAKDKFMNKFNAARDKFGQRFEQMKNDYHAKQR